jgi:hypothetical protein
MDVIRRLIFTSSTQSALADKAIITLNDSALVSGNTALNHRGQSPGP